MTTKITIWRGRDSWMANWAGPGEDYVRDLFGCTDLPTGYTLAAPVLEVLAELRKLNPGCTVEVGQ